MADVTSKKLQEYKDSLKTKAEDLILKGIPETILKLNDILETTPFLNGEFPDVRQDLNIPIPEPDSHIDSPLAKETKSSQDDTKVLISPSGSVSSNEHFIELIKTIKPLFRKLDDDSMLLKMWITLMIPKVEDGNNFGVSVQEYALSVIKSGESQAADFFDHISRCYVARGKLISKVMKYPHIDDYKRAVQELDEVECLNLRFVMNVLRNTYCLFHDVIVKNLEKIKEPRSTDATESLY